MWVGMKKATAAIVDDGETGTSASLRGHSVCYWWAADVYGYSKRLTSVTIVALFMASKAGALETKTPRMNAQWRCQHSCLWARVYLFFAYKCICIFLLLKSLAVQISKFDFMCMAAVSELSAVFKSYFFPPWTGKEEACKELLMHRLHFQNLLWHLLTIYLFHLRHTPSWINASLRS